MKRLKFGCKFPSKWLSFQSQSTDDGPYEIVTHLHRPQGQANSVSERFERRALQIAKSVTS